MSHINDILTAPLSPGEPGYRSRDVDELCMDEKDLHSPQDGSDTEPLDHHQMNSISFPPLARSPMADCMKQQFVQDGVAAASSQEFSHQHFMPTVAFDSNGIIQPSMMWNVDPSVRHPGEKPKRPLSAYNFYFQLERERIIEGDINDKDLITVYKLEDVARIALIQQKKAKENKPKEKRSHRKTHGKISFGDLARTIANKWKKLDDKTKAIFEGSASIEKERYKKELAEWTKQQKKWKEAASRMSAMGPMMFPTGNAGAYNLVTPPQLPKKTVLGDMSVDHEIPSSNDAMAIAMMNQKLMNEYSGRSASTVRSHPGMMSSSQSQFTQPSSMNMMSLGRRASTGGIGMSTHNPNLQPRQQQQQLMLPRYSSDFFDNGGDDIMNGMNNDFSYQQMSDETFNNASSSFSSPTVSPNDFHNRAIISQQRQMQIMLMKRQQTMLQKQHQEQQQDFSPSAMMHHMMMMKCNNGASRSRNGHNSSFMDNGQSYDNNNSSVMDGPNHGSNSNNSSRGTLKMETYDNSEDMFHHHINDNFSQRQHSQRNHLHHQN